MRPPFRYDMLGLAALFLHRPQVATSQRNEWTMRDKLLWGHQSNHWTFVTLLRQPFKGSSTWQMSRLRNRVGAENSEGDFMPRIVACHPGNTVITENAHQKAKDLVKTARQNFASRIHKYHSVLALPMFCQAARFHM